GLEPKASPLPNARFSYRRPGSKSSIQIADPILAQPQAPQRLTRSAQCLDAASPPSLTQRRPSQESQMRGPQRKEPLPKPRRPAQAASIGEAGGPARPPGRQSLRPQPSIKMPQLVPSMQKVCETTYHKVFKLIVIQKVNQNDPEDKECFQEVFGSCRLGIGQ